MQVPCHWHPMFEHWSNFWDSTLIYFNNDESLPIFDNKKNINLLSTVIFLLVKAPSFGNFSLQGVSHSLPLSTWQQTAGFFFDTFCRWGDPNIQTQETMRGVTCPEFRNAGMPMDFTIYVVMSPFLFKRQAYVSSPSTAYIDIHKRLVVQHVEGILRYKIWQHEACSFNLNNLHLELFRWPKIWGGKPCPPNPSRRIVYLWAGFGPSQICLPPPIPGLNMLLLTVSSCPQMDPLPFSMTFGHHQFLGFMIKPTTWR